MGNDITILIGGAAGQGIQTIGALLAKVCHNAGLFIFSMDDFESRVRGGHNFHLLVFLVNAGGNRRESFNPLNSLKSLKSVKFLKSSNSKVVCTNFDFLKILFI